MLKSPTIRSAAARRPAYETIVSIVSAGGPTEAGPIAYGMDLPDVVDDLKQLLATGKPLAEAGAAGTDPATPAVRRLGVGDGSSRDIGARFVKP